MGGRSARGIGVVVVLACSLGLGGCSLLHGNYGAVPSPSHAATKQTAAEPTPTGPPPSPLPSPSVTPVAADTVVASGTVVSPKGSVRFSYRVVATGTNDFQVQYTNVANSLPVPVSVAFAEAAPAVSVGDGLGTNRVASTVLGASAVSATLGVGTDPSALTQLVTYSSVDAGQAGVPVELGPDKVLAVSQVHWNVPVRASNVHPVDGGERYFAYGIVQTTRADGAPATYLVAHGDRAVVVAQRFGISLQDLLWLNPSIKTYSKDRYLYEGTTINLDPNAL